MMDQEGAEPEEPEMTDAQYEEMAKQNGMSVD